MQKESKVRRSPIGRASMGKAVVFLDEVLRVSSKSNDALTYRWCVDVILLSQSQLVPASTRQDDGLQYNITHNIHAQALRVLKCLILTL